jgi:hypothetical protein
VSQRFGFVDGAEELGKRQRGTKTDCDKPRAQGRCAHAVIPPQPAFGQSLRHSSAVDNHAVLADGKPSARLGRAETVDQAIGEAVQQLEVLIGAASSVAPSGSSTLFFALVPSITVSTSVGSNWGLSVSRALRHAVPGA